MSRERIDSRDRVVASQLRQLHASCSEGGPEPTSSASGRWWARAAKAASMSLQLLALSTWICSPMPRAPPVSRRATCLSGHDIGRIDEQSDAGGRGHQFAQEFQPLGDQLNHEKIDAGEVAARAGSGW